MVRCLRAQAQKRPIKRAELRRRDCLASRVGRVSQAGPGDQAEAETETEGVVG